ncbi:MAG: GNAT family N-acetyltransferase [Brevinema sp.]
MRSILRENISAGIGEYDSKTQTAMIAVWIAYQSQGYGFDTLLCTFLFDEMNVRKIKLHYFAFNTKAQNLYTKLGFKEEGILRKEIFRFVHDIHLMGMFREEFLTTGK